MPLMIGPVTGNSMGNADMDMDMAIVCDLFGMVK